MGAARRVLPPLTISRMGPTKGASPIARLHGCARVLGLEPSKSSYGLRPSTVLAPASLSACITGDVLLLVLDQLALDVDKVALACVTHAILHEQRRLRPQTAFRLHVSLTTLVGAQQAGWRMAHCHVDKRSGTWVASGEEDDVLADLETLSIVGRPDCALLVLSPFTDLSTMTRLTTFELDACAIGNAGVGVLSAAIRNGAMPCLTVLDLRRNQVGDGGALALAAALLHDRGSSLQRLTTLGLDQNQIGDRGFTALAATLSAGSLFSLRQLFVDDPLHDVLCKTCRHRRIEVSAW